MTTSKVAMLCAVTLLGGFTFSTILPDDRSRWSEPAVESTPAMLPYPTSALSGVWEGTWGHRMPTRVVVERLHPECATVLLAWGDVPVEGIPSGSMRLRAKILPDGRLHVADPFQLTFTLSEDGRDLVGTRGPADPSVSVVLKRVAPDTALARLDAASP